MRSVFTETAECRIDSAACSVCLNDLTALLRKFSHWEYVCVQTKNGFFLYPTFRDMSYRNSFVPEIDIVISHDDSQTVVRMQGQPIRIVRILVTIFCVFALIMELLVLLIALTSGFDSLIPVFIPVGLSVFGYLLCKIATRATFRSVVAAIQTGLKHL